jgi:hypothetical protein
MTEQQYREGQVGTLQIRTGEIFYDVKIIEVNPTHVRIEMRCSHGAERRSIHRTNIREWMVDGPRVTFLEDGTYRSTHGGITVEIDPMFGIEEAGDE